MILAIDPGKSGALAVYDGETMEVRKMPDSEVGLWALFNEMAVIPDRVYIERVQAMPGGGERRMGATSAFTFGRGYGALRMAVIAAGLPLEDVRPQQWQRELGLGKLAGPDRKKRLRAIAAERFPAVKPTLQTCDAVLLAEWGWRQRG